MSDLIQIGPIQPAEIRPDDGKTGPGGSFYNVEAGPKQKIDAVLEAEAHKVHWWQQTGFRRGVGTVLQSVAAVFYLVGKETGDMNWYFIGAAINVIGGAIGLIGVAKAAKNSDPSINGDEGLWYSIKQIADKKRKKAV